MNYIEQIRRFWQCNNERPIGCNATALYFYLLNINNSLGWKDTFRHSDRYIAIQLGISVNTVRNAKNLLSQLGLLYFRAPQKKSKSLDGCTLYSFTTVLANDTDVNTDIDTVVNTVSPSVSNTDTDVNTDADMDVNTDADTDVNTDADTRIKLNKTKQNKTLSLSSESLRKEEERERLEFLEILFFEKRILMPEDEAGRFSAHYEKTEWKDANGNVIKNKLAALRGWKVAEGLPTLGKNFAERWRALYDAVKVESIRSVLMITDLCGYQIAGNCLKLSVTDALRRFIEDPDTLTAIKPVFLRVFPGLTLEYLITKKN